MSWFISSVELLGLALVVLLLPVPGGNLRASEDRSPLDTDSAYETTPALHSTAPVLGPILAPVQIELFLPVGSTLSTQILPVLLRLAREAQDVRLTYHLVPVGSTQADRGAQILWEAWLKDRFWPVCEFLHSHPDLVLPENEPALLQALASLGVAQAPLREALKVHRHALKVAEEWRSQRPIVSYPPEVWINGKRLRSVQKEDPLRLEIAQARERAQELLSDGVPPDKVYDRLLRKERPGEQARGATFIDSPGEPGGHAGRAFIEVQDAPSRGPRVAPVRLVLFGAMDLYGTHAFATPLRQVISRHPDRLCLYFKHVPTTAASRQTALLLAQLGRVSPEKFFQAYDLLSQALDHQFRLNQTEVTRLLAQVGVDPRKLAAAAERDAQRLVDGDIAQAQSLGLTNGPALAVNGILLRSVPSIDALDSLVRAELDLGFLERLRQRRTETHGKGPASPGRPAP